MGNCMGNNKSKQETGNAPPPANEDEAALARVARKPVMADADRSRAVDVYVHQFGVDKDFLANATMLKMRLGRRVSAARERISSRQNSFEEPQEGGQQQQQDRQEGLNKKTSTFYRIKDDTDSQRATREDRIRAGIDLLGQRMVNFKLEQQVMKDDGNCLFRSLSHQLTGTEENHLAIRREVVAYMKSVRELEFDFLFESPAEADSYYAAMNENGTWGDELTLRAASDAFNLKIHVLTSEETNYYVQYQPNQECGWAKEVADRKDASLDVFLGYISPIHYNSVVVAAAAPATTDAAAN